MRRKNFRFSSFSAAIALAAALTLAGSASAFAAATEEAEEEVVEIVTEEEPAGTEEFDESEAEVAGTEEEAAPAEEAPAEEAAEPAEETAPAAPVSQTEYIKQYLEQSLDSDLTSVIIGMSDEEIEQNIQYGEGFSKTAVEAWNGVKAELGERKADAETTVTVEEGEDKTYIATQNVQFEKHDADFIYTFDQNMTPTDLTINVNYPMSVTLQRAGLNTLMGLGTVFLMLIFLSLVISLFKYIPNGSKKKQVEEATPAPVRAAAPEPEYVEETDDQELVAVIAAAIAAAEGTTPDGFVVRSIRRAGRSRR